jgi:hypothetical protein
MKITKLINGKHALVECFDEGGTVQRWRIVKSGTRKQLMNWILSLNPLTNVDGLRNVPRIEVAKLGGADVIVESGGEP